MENLYRFSEDGQVMGFIDLGKTGIGDKWNDIALCYRSLKHNFDGRYGGKVYDYWRVLPISGRSNLMKIGK